MLNSDRGASLVDNTCLWFQIYPVDLAMRVAITIQEALLSAGKTASERKQSFAIKRRLSLIHVVAPPVERIRRRDQSVWLRGQSVRYTCIHILYRVVLASPIIQYMTPITSWHEVGTYLTIYCFCLSSHPCMSPLARRGGWRWHHTRDTFVRGFPTWDTG